MRHLVFVLTVSLVGCGAPTGPASGGVYFWKMLTSTVEFGACSDEPAFRAEIKPVSIGANTYFVYKVAADGKTAITQRCDRLDPKSCVDPEEPDVYDITGKELTRTETFKTPIDMSTCALSQTVTETLIDADKTMTLDLVSVLTLVDSPTDCATVETNVKRTAPNMLGIEGCVVTRKLTGEIK